MARTRKPPQILKDYRIVLRHTPGQLGVGTNGAPLSVTSSVELVHTSDTYRRLDFTAMRFPLPGEPASHVVIEYALQRINKLRNDQLWWNTVGRLGAYDIPSCVRVVGGHVYDVCRMLPALKLIDDPHDSLQLSPDPLWNLVLIFSHAGAVLDAPYAEQMSKLSITEWSTTPAVLKALADAAQARYERAANIERTDTMLEIAAQPIPRKEELP